MGQPRKSAGQVAYEAYGDHAHWKAHTGDPMPSWEDLPDVTKQHWEVAASEVLRSYRG